MTSDYPRIVFSAEAVTKTCVSGAVEVRALRGIDLEIRAGKVVVLLGPSGSGKSTSLNIMGGLDRATSGRRGLAGVATSANVS